MEIILIGVIIFLEVVLIIIFNKKKTVPMSEYDIIIKKHQLIEIYNKSRNGNKITFTKEYLQRIEELIKK